MVQGSAQPLAASVQSDQKRNVKKRRLKYGKNKEWILIFKRKLDRINRIIGIKRPLAERAPRRRRKYPVNPV